MLEIKELHVSFKQRPWLFGLVGPATIYKVLKGVNLKVNRGQVCGILGRNGEGKSTLFRTIIGVYRQNMGSVLIDGVKCVDPRGRFSMAQTEFRNPEMICGVKDFLMLSGVLNGMSIPETQKRIDELDERLNFKSFWNKSGIGLSTGQRARVGLASSLIYMGSDVFIFDEPSNGVDYETVSIVYDLIRSLKNENKIILLSSHIMPDLESNSDELYLMRDGVLHSDFHVEQLKRNDKGEVL